MSESSAVAAAVIKFLPVTSGVLDLLQDKTWLLARRNEQLRNARALLVLKHGKGAMTVLLDELKLYESTTWKRRRNHLKLPENASELRTCYWWAFRYGTLANGRDPLQVAGRGFTMRWLGSPPTPHDLTENPIR